MLCERYSWTIEYVLSLKMKHYRQMIKEIGIINELQNGDSKQDQENTYTGEEATQRLSETLKTLNRKQ